MRMLATTEQMRELDRPAIATRRIPDLPPKAEAAREVELVPPEKLLPKGWKERER